MRAFELNKIQKPVFSTDDISKTLGISGASAKVAASRYAKKKILTRLKRDLYMLSGRLQSLPEEELFRLANLIQVPSYVSLTTALSYYGITTQQQQYFIESIALKRTKSVSAENVSFAYTRIQKPLYTGYVLKDGFFIALPEKALADCVCLASLKRTHCDFSAVDFKKTDLKKVGHFLNGSSHMTRKFWKTLCGNYSL